MLDYEQIETQIKSKEDIWTTKSGKRIPFSQLDQTHLDNIFNSLIEKLAAGSPYTTAIALTLKKIVTEMNRRKMFVPAPKSLRPTTSLMDDLVAKVMFLKMKDKISGAISEAKKDIDKIFPSYSENHYKPLGTITASNAVGKEAELKEEVKAEGEKIHNLIIDPKPFKDDLTEHEKEYKVLSLLKKDHISPYNWLCCVKNCGGQVKGSALSIKTFNRNHYLPLCPVHMNNIMLSKDPYVTVSSYLEYDWFTPTVSELPDFV